MAGALRALGHRPRYPFGFDTRHNSFGVLSAASVGGFSATRFLCNPREQAPVNEPHHVTMPTTTEAVSSQRRLTAEDVQTVRTAAFVTSPFYHVSWQQRLSPLASIPAIRRITDADSVTVFAKLYLFSSYALAPRHFTTYSAPASERSY